MSEYRVRVAQDLMRDGLLISFYRYDGKEIEVYKPSGEWIQRTMNHAMEEGDFLFLPQHSGFAQALVDALYEAGVKPKAYVPSKGEMEATHKHLDDMRAIVAKQLRVSLKDGPL